MSAAALALAAGMAGRLRERGESQPNFIIIFCDDLGYGDLHCYGAEKIQTQPGPHGGRGNALQQPYACAPVCTPRAQDC